MVFFSKILISLLLVSLSLVIKQLKYRNYGIVLSPINIEFHKKNNAKVRHPSSHSSSL
ncbi:MAG: hypothetical protein ACJA0U_000606 [Salibacteraceae bacterium]|jgi:hypothetical protein